MPSLQPKANGTAKRKKNTRRVRKWRARVRTVYGERYLGTFDTWDEAFAAEEEAREFYQLDRRMMRIKPRPSDGRQG